MVQIMAWRRQGDKPLSEPMNERIYPQWMNAYMNERIYAQWMNAYMRRTASMS